LADTFTQRQNVGSYRGSTSRYRGVHWDPVRHKWRVICRLRGQRFRLGRYDNEDEAGAVAQRWRDANMPFAQKGTQS
jgi:hypothetical protein